MNHDASETRSTAALFGYFRYGNFGDDLMAAIVGQHAAASVPVRVFGPSVKTPDGGMLPGADSVDDVVRDAGIVIYGGGGAFLRQAAGRSPSAYEDELSELCRAVDRMGIPLHLVSVGGEGSSPDALTDARRQLLSTATSGTFRNVEDQALMDAIEGPANAHDDVVWLTPQFFDKNGHNSSTSTREVGSSDTLVIAVDGHLYRSRIMRLYVRALKAWLAISGAKVDIRVFWQHKTPVPSSFPADTIIYRDLGDFVGSIAGSHLVITSRLHMGLVAMSYGRTVVGFRPSPKQVLLFTRFGMAHQLFRSKMDALRLAWIIAGRRRVRKFVNKNRYAHSGERASSAAAHLSELDDALREPVYWPSMRSAVGAEGGESLSAHRIFDR